MCKRYKELKKKVADDDHISSNLKEYRIFVSSRFIFTCVCM